MSDPSEAVYLEFSSFDWENFPEFQEGIQEILQNHLQSLQENDATVTAIPPGEKQQLIDQAKSFFYCTKTGNILSLDDYYAWKRKNGGKITLLEVSELDPAESLAASTESGPIPTDSFSPEGSSNQQQEGHDAPYSSNYQELVNLIVSGKPVPGIKDIPDTVLSDQKSESHEQTRAKPWEKSSATTTDMEGLAK